MDLSSVASVSDDGCCIDDMVLYDDDDGGVDEGSAWDYGFVRPCGGAVRSAAFL